MPATKKSYLGLTLTGTGPLSEIIGERLIELGAVGVEERPKGAGGELDLDVDYGIEEWGAEPPAETAVERELRSAFLLAEWDTVQPQVRQLVNAVKVMIPDLEMNIEQLPDFDQLARWRKDLKRFVLSDTVGVAPVRSMVPDDGRTWLIIPPRMAFGTGEHETTRMAAKLTSEWTKPNDRVLDAGCGTGILGLTALASGAGYCLGIDIEADAIREARQNVRRNGFAGCMNLREGSILSTKYKPGEKFDLILANIHLNVLKEWWYILPSLLYPGGRVIATGLLVGQGKKLGRTLGSAVLRRQSHSWIVPDGPPIRFGCNRRSVNFYFGLSEGERSRK